MTLLTVFDWLSRIGTFMLIFSTIFFISKYTICKLLQLHKYLIYNKIYMDDAISIIISLIIILNFVTISSPYA